MLKTDEGVLEGLCTVNQALLTSFTSFYCFASSGVDAAASSHTLLVGRSNVLPTTGLRHKPPHQP